MDTQKCEISNVQNDLSGQGNVIRAHLHLTISESSVAALDVYVGNNDHLYIKGFGENCAYPTESIIQWAAWLVTHESWIIWNIKEIASNS